MKLTEILTTIIVATSLFLAKAVEGGFTDYINNIREYLSPPGTAEISTEYPQIPYEVSVSDEKFISEAAKLTGVALSDLDSCQHRVVLKLKVDCHKMNDEEVAKMAVHLLNCQSYVEGRPLYPCNDDMSIKQCTTNMDSDTWTSYHLMSNRARAVCYSIRQIQFRGLAEHTVNKLMEASSKQLNTLGEVARTQGVLQDIAENTLDSLSKGHEELSQQQKDIQQAQFHGQLALEDNINRLFKEKQLIMETHNLLVGITKSIQEKLKDSSRQLEAQLGESRDNHRELLDDLIAIQNQAHQIFAKIEESSKLLWKQSEDFQKQYEFTLRNLAEVNKTVHHLVKMVGGTRQALEDRLLWLTRALGGTDMAVERLYLIMWHSIFMMIAMLSCAFVSAHYSIRLVVVTVPPLNLAAAVWGTNQHFGPFGLATSIVGFAVVQTLLLSASGFRSSIKGALMGPKEKVSSSNDDKKNAKSTLERISETETFECSLRTEIDDFGGSPTPPLSRAGFYSPHSRGSTPLGNLLNNNYKGACHARTRLGTPCKLSSLPGRDYCHRHQSGESVMG